jgi:outer membrane protein assembly factor BamB
VLGAGLVFFVGANETLYALNKSTGALVWVSTRIHGSLCVLGATLLVGGSDSSGEVGLWAVNALNGLERWSYADPAWAGLGTSGGLTIGGIAADSSIGHVIVTTGYGYLADETALTPIGVYCVNASTGALIWKTKTSIGDTSLIRRAGLGSPSIDAEGNIFVPGCACTTGTSSYDAKFCAYSLFGNGTLLSFSFLPDIDSFRCQNKLALASSGYLYTSTSLYILALVAGPPAPPASSSPAFSAAAVVGASVAAACVAVAGLLYYIRKRSSRTPDSYRFVAEGRYMAA